MTVNEYCDNLQFSPYRVLFDQHYNPDLYDILTIITPNDSRIDGADIDIRTRCGNSEISSLLEVSILKNPTEFIRSLYSSIIKNKFLTKWTRLLLTFNVDYNPLTPLNIETEEHITDVLRTIKDKVTNVDTDSYYGFNSNNGSPAENSATTTDREYDRENPIDRETTRKGNIGNHDNTSLMLKYLEYVNTVVYDIIIKDICGLISRGYYK